MRKDEKAGEHIEKVKSKSASSEQVTVPVVEEEIHVGSRVVEGDKVRVTRSSVTSTERVDVEALKEEVQVKRVPVDRVIEKPVETREEGDVTIIPVMEEVVIVTKQLVLKEEIHLIRSKVSTPVTHEIEVEKQEIEIERLRV